MAMISMNFNKMWRLIFKNDIHGSFPVLSDKSLAKTFGEMGSNRISLAT